MARFNSASSPGYSRRRSTVRTAPSACRPRVHDLSHTFADSPMLDAYRPRDDPAVVLPVLSTWLGHKEPRDTYWYLTGTAELLEAAATRLDTTDEERALT